MQTASSNIFLSRTDATSVLMQATHYKKIKCHCDIRLKAPYIIPHVTQHYLLSHGISLYMRCIYHMGGKEKENAFLRHSFYFLHQHFKTGQQISCRRRDSEELTIAHTWVGARRRKKAAHAHMHVFTHPVKHISNIIQHMDWASTHFLSGTQIA